MTVREKLRKQIFSWLTVGVLCITGVSVCMTSCQLLGNAQSDDKETLPSTQKDAYEAKIVYYEAQIQNLTAQLGEMEQQFYVLREDYMSQLEELEEKLSENKNPTETPDQPNADTSSGEDGDNTSPPAGDTDTSGDIVLCEYTYRLENGYAILTSYLGNDKDVVIPAAVDGYLVIGLGDRMFADCEVYSVTLPQTVERLGWFTFYGCKNLQKVVLPAGISNIGYASFDGCPSTLCLYVSDGSYAEQFALSFGLNYQKDM